MNVLEMEDALKEVQYKGWEVSVGLDGERPFLQVSCMDKCEVKGEVELQKGRKWFLSPHMSKSEIVMTAFKACLTAEEHECREKFKYKGQAIFGPHFNVDVLHEICVAGNHQEKRT